MGRKRRKRATATEKSEESSQEASFSPEQAWAFCKEHKQHFFFGFMLLLLIIPLFLSINTRTFAVSLEVTDDWARSSVNQNIRNQIAAQVSQQYPNLPATSRDQLVNEQMAQFLESNSQEYQSQVRQTSDHFKSRMQNDDGQTYLIAIDPYEHLRRTEKVIENGIPGDKVLPDGSYFDGQKLAPLGTPAELRFHTWFMAKLYNFLHLFNPNLTPLALFFWLPVIFIPFCIIPAFFIGMRKAGLLAGFFAATLVAVHAGFIGRTAAGFSDTDVFVVLFPLLASFFFIEAFESKPGEWKRMLGFTALCGLTFGLFSFTWTSWWFFYDVLLIVLVGYGVYMLLRALVQRQDMLKFIRSKEVQWWGITSVSFYVINAIFTIPFLGFKAYFLAPFRAVLTTSSIKAAVGSNTIWPNVLTTVAELNAPSIGGIISNIGGKFLFFIALMGILFTLVSQKRLSVKDWGVLLAGLLIFLFLLSARGTQLSITSFLLILALPIFFGAIMLLKDQRGIDVKYAIFLTAWIVASVFTMTKGVRFVLLLIPPFALASGIAIGTAYNLLVDALSRAKFSKIWVAPILFLLLSLLLLQPIQAGYRIGKQEVPSMTDTWWNSLSKIREESAPDAIINSWWDFGHWFKYVTRRGVTFDGGSQNTPMAHWIGKVLLTDNEQEALGILRMLDCGSYTGVERLREALATEDYYVPIALMKEIILQSPDVARQTLAAAGVGAADIEELLKLTHCDPPENYFITSGDMVGKAGVWGHFGGWSFEKADAYQNFRRLPQQEAVRAMSEKYDWTTDQATTIYSEMQALPSQEAVNTWISPWPGYGSPSLRSCTASGEDAYSCSLNIGLAHQQGTRPVVTSLLINTTNTSQSYLTMQFVDDQQRVIGQNNDVVPNNLFFAGDDDFTKVRFTGSNRLGQSFLVDMVEGVPSRVMMVADTNGASMFTRLFFLNGKGTTAFEKFSDQTTFTGIRIIVWKVDWSKLETYGMA